MWMAWLSLVLLAAGSAASDDSLRGALEAVQRRQRDLASSVYLPRLMGDGQPEDIGYGFQKSMAPNTAGVFEPVALPSSELGNTDERVAESRALEKLLLEYLEESEENGIPRTAGEYYPRGYPVGSKRSIFRERDDSDFPEALQRLYEAEGEEKEEVPVFLPSPFRERLGDGGRRARLQGAHPPPPRSYAGLARGGFEEGGLEDEDRDEYLAFLNALLEKYKGSEREEDPSDEVSEAEAEEILDYLGRKEERKRQYGGSYGQGYDFFNSPLAWAKRSREEDVGRLVMTAPSGREGRRRDYAQEAAAFDDRYGPLQKRFPITKRSLSYLEGPRRKKNAAGTAKPETDPKVAEELNDIFAGEKKPEGVKTAAKNESLQPGRNVTETGSPAKSPGQKERAEGGTAVSRPVEVKKKSIDWSDYFGMDRRRKKSGRADQDWLLEQYLKAYGLRGGLEDPNASLDDKKRPSDDEMDSELRAMEDLIVDQAVKYTGSHEGTTDSREVQEVKERVMAQLAAAYSLEKMRRALGEFKSSLAAQKVTAPQSHSIPMPKIERVEEKTKRIAVKKEKVDVSPAEGRIEKKDSTHEISNMIKDSDRDYEKEEILECPILQDIELRCNEIGTISGDKEEIFTPLCMLHQICYLCGPEVGGGSPRGCDASFLSEARSVCRDEPACYQAARRTLTSSRAARGGGGGCDLRAHPCLGQFLAIAAKRR